MIRRIAKLERAMLPEESRGRITMCQAPQGLTPVVHAAWHAERGRPMCFTLDLGACDVRGDG